MLLQRGRTCRRGRPSASSTPRRNNPQERSRESLSRKAPIWLRGATGSDQCSLHFSLSARSLSALTDTPFGAAFGPADLPTDSGVGPVLPPFLSRSSPASQPRRPTSGMVVGETISAAG